MKKKRQYRSNQGKSPEDMKKSYKIAGWSLIGLFISIIFIIICK